MNLEDYLPANLRGPATTITRVAAGLSGAGVYRVEAGGEVFVLKVAGEGETEWQRRLSILQAAAEAGIAPRIVHVDAERRAVLSVFHEDRGFPILYNDPRTRDAAIALLGKTLRRVHALPLSPELDGGDPRAFVDAIWSDLAGSTFIIPAFVTATVRRVLDEEPPPRDREIVLSHNDVNPSNLLYDGEQLWMLDWNISGPNDPFYDLAAAAVFLRMDDATCKQLLAAHDDAPIVDELPPRFAYNRRLVATLCGTMFVKLARDGGHAGGEVSVDDALSLADFYQGMRAGQFSIAKPDGKWAFGLALVKASPA